MGAKLTSEVDKEIEAIKTVLSTLSGLPQDIRNNVLAYVLKRLEIRLELPGRQPDKTATTPPPTGEIYNSSAPEVTHIKTFKEQKKPKSATEMAVVVAYYLSQVAQGTEKKEAINAKDAVTYFKIADFPLSKQMRFTLVNAKSAGYLDSVGNGEYRLNAVGHNLVAHNLPRSGQGNSLTHRKRRPKKKS